MATTITLGGVTQCYVKMNGWLISDPQFEFGIKGIGRAGYSPAIHKAVAIGPHLFSYLETISRKERFVSTAKSPSCMEIVIIPSEFRRTFDLCAKARNLFCLVQSAEFETEGICFSLEIVIVGVRHRHTVTV